MRPEPIPYPPKLEIPTDILEDFLKGKHSNLRNYLYYLTRHSKMPKLEIWNKYFINE